MIVRHIRILIIHCYYLDHHHSEHIFCVWEWKFVFCFFCGDLLRFSVLCLALVDVSFFTFELFAHLRISLFFFLNNPVRKISLLGVFVVILFLLQRQFVQLLYLLCGGFAMISEEMDLLLWYFLLIVLSILK